MGKMGAITFIEKHGLFMSQFFFSALGVGFSIGMLLRGNDPSIYLPILTTVIGVWTPNPLSMSRTMQQASQPVVQDMASVRIVTQ